MVSILNFGVQDHLFKLKIWISDTDKFRLCGEQKETITQLFQCAKSATLWQNIVSWIQSNMCIRINLEQIEKILGYAKVDSKFCH